MRLQRVLPLGVALALLAMVSPSRGDGPAPPFQEDDLLLWKAAMIDKFYHNREIILPEPLASHVALVSRYAGRPDDSKRSRLAQLIAAKEYVLDRQTAIEEKDSAVRSRLPGEWTKAKIKAFVRGLAGAELPTMKDALAGDLAEVVGSFDEMRENRVLENHAKLSLELLGLGIAELVEAQYQAKLGDRPLPKELGLIVDKLDGDEVGMRTSLPGRPRYPLGCTFVRLSYTGAKPLNDVVVVTKCLMKPLDGKAVAGQQSIKLFNEIFDRGADRNRAAAEYMDTNNLLNTTPKGCLVYVPRLEQGDVLHVPLYTHGYFYYIREARYSLFSDQGALRDQVVMRAGPQNDLSRAMGGRRPPPRVVTKPTGPRFEKVQRNTRVELVLQPPKDGGRAHSFEGCVPDGEAFRGTGQKFSIEVDGQKPLEAIARGPEAFVALGLPRARGNGLIFVPRSVVAQTKVIDERPEDEKAEDPSPRRGQSKPLRRRR